MKRRKSAGVAGTVVTVRVLRNFRDTIGMVSPKFPKFAYIDAGTASMLFQLLIAGVLGGLVSLKMFWSRVKNFFASFRRKGAADDQQP